MQIKSLGDTSTLTWKQYECELCKTPFPYAFNLSGKRWDMIEYKKPIGKPFIVLESIWNEKNTSRQAHMIVVDHDWTEFRIGRGHESDIRINDISVSRTHVVLRYIKDKGFELEDRKSKFGTLVFLKDPIKIEANKIFAIQIGWTVITAT